MACKGNYPQANSGSPVLPPYFGCFDKDERKTFQKTELMESECKDVVRVDEVGCRVWREDT